MKGALFGGAGAGLGTATNKILGNAAQKAFDNLPLADKVFVSSKALSGPYLPAGTPNWAIGGTVTGNAVSNVFSNLNQ